MLNLKKLSIIIVMDDFTIRLLKNHKKTILRECVLSLLRLREKINIALTPLLNVNIM